ncbi:AIPR protein OS=Rhizobium sp. CF122 GN=PMI09_00693 PE=4 SV=1: AIPR [Tuwongella immobilis]|uniref:Abortive phage infection protein C-terminal domain-containing protein n=2 Tax=Tuwongella immobilis TaxID=692036 RepID=A0A6C2YH99_9BACT|nr:AIPR protein OS=Rhizobium sp. CF122 GN=PMI09_00693 PE=4 SV=1: AIPR [Tuwongella immobilis]VTR96696.1 AIPR protein OS=Rhizobium sp. CF122 GN=PMI09_00693 PE=4 SV=1: AIPR [Tuwongella immobilis]
MSKSTLQTPTYPFAFFNCRNISCPEDQASKRKVIVGYAPSTSFFELDDNENVREYLVDAVGKLKQRPTLVHLSIRNTLAERPEDFSVLNNGICITAHKCQIDEAKRLLILTKPSIINGSQTQGELKRFYAANPNALPVSVKFEIIVTDDTGIIAEVAIARNFQNDVRAISIAGRRGKFDQLEEALQTGNPNLKLRRTETDLSDEYLDTEKLLQVLFALVPDELAIGACSGLKNKTFAYSQKAKCLKLFEQMQKCDSIEQRDVYQFFLDVAYSAWTLYEKWQTHQGFQGTGLRSIVRGENREISHVPDGIIFPIIAAHSAFCKRDEVWKLEVPDSFDASLIQAAVDDYKDVADHNPQTMGKKQACYRRLLDLSRLYARLAKN